MKNKIKEIDGDLIEFHWNSWREIFNYIYHDYLNGNITEALWNHLESRLEHLKPELIDD